MSISVAKTWSRQGIPFSAMSSPKTRWPANRLPAPGGTADHPDADFLHRVVLAHDFTRPRLHGLQKASLSRKNSVTEISVSLASASSSSGYRSVLLRYSAGCRYRWETLRRCSRHCGGGYLVARKIDPGALTRTPLEQIGQFSRSLFAAVRVREGFPESAPAFPSSPSRSGPAGAMRSATQASMAERGMPSYFGGLGHLDEGDAPRRFDRPQPAGAIRSRAGQDYPDRPFLELLCPWTETGF